MVLVRPLLDRTEELEAELHDLRSTLRKAQVASEESEQLAAEHRRVGRELVTLERLLPADPEIDELTGMLRSLGAGDVEVEVEPEPTVEHDLYFAVPIGVRARGGPEAVLGFLRRLSRVSGERLAAEAAPQRPALNEQPPPGTGRLLHTERFTMTRTGDEVEATLLVEAYAMKSR